MVLSCSHFCSKCLRTSSAHETKNKAVYKTLGAVSISKNLIGQNKVKVDNKVKTCQIMAFDKVFVFFESNFSNNPRESN